MNQNRFPISSEIAVCPECQGLLYILLLKEQPASQDDIAVCCEGDERDSLERSKSNHDYCHEGWTAVIKSAFEYVQSEK